MHPEPKKHHYIPQFILKNFCVTGNRLYYYDKKSGSVSEKTTRDVFMMRNLYRCEMNSVSDPVKIEKDLSKFEQEAAQIIRDRFLSHREFFLTNEENEKLKLFFAIMGFRSLNTKNRFSDSCSPATKAFFSHYQADGNILDLWKRNLGYIVQCRSFEEIRMHSQIDEPIKLFFQRDIRGYFSKYIAVAEADDKNELIISDAYPVTIHGILPNGAQLDMYDIYPISPKRVIFIANTGLQGTPKNVLCLRNFLFQPPKLMEATNLLRFRVKTLCTDEVHYLNREIAKNSTEGFAFRHAPPNIPTQ